MKPFDPRVVAVYQAVERHYPERTPFHPHVDYPEYQFGETAGEANQAYDAVRECLRTAGLDAHRFGTRDWNPLGEFIRPGETVLLKPNLVKESHPRDPGGWRYVLTHGSVIRAVADYVWRALEGRGRVVLADAPQTDSSFDRIVQVLGLDSLVRFYRERGLTLDLIDLRREEWESRDGVIVGRRSLPGDPAGGVPFDLGARSEFVSHGGAGRYYGADYDAGEVNRHHSGGRHEYLIAGSAVRCDVFVNLPKLKTHKKAGITVALKNLVGINADKNWLPHHTEGDPTSGGDEHPAPSGKHRLERRIVPWFRRLSRSVPVVGPLVHRGARRVGGRVFGDTEEVVRSGNWWGNDTIWRMCLDLNKLALYGAVDGTLRPPGAAGRKRYLAIVDGIVAGEGRGPMNPDPVQAGLILFGTNPASVDAASAYLMGFDPAFIPIVRQAFRCTDYPLAEWQWTDVRLLSNRTEWQGPLAHVDPESTFRFRAHFGWAGRLERAAR